MTALDGVFCPSPDATAWWAMNSGGQAKARFGITLTTRGTTGLADGDDAGLLLESNSGGTGTLAFDATIKVNWK